MKLVFDGRSGTAIERSGFMMNDYVDERRYAWRMIRAARATHAGGMNQTGSALCRAEVVDLLDEALDAGLDRAELIVELADLGARLFALCNPESAERCDTALPGEAEVCLT